MAKPAWGETELSRINKQQQKNIVNKFTSPNCIVE
jgi:hypothetical protein